MAIVLDSDDKENGQHLNAIEMLAKDYGKSTEEVTLIYTNILNDFQRKHVSIKLYLPILVSKKVKELIKHCDTFSSSDCYRQSTPPEIRQDGRT